MNNIAVSPFQVYITLLLILHLYIFPLSLLFPEEIVTSSLRTVSDHSLGQQNVTHNSQSPEQNMDPVGIMIIPGNHTITLGTAASKHSIV